MLTKMMKIDTETGGDRTFLLGTVNSVKITVILDLRCQLKKYLNTSIGREVQILSPGSSDNGRYTC